MAFACEQNAELAGLYSTSNTALLALMKVVRVTRANLKLRKCVGQRLPQFHGLAGMIDGGFNVDHTGTNQLLDRGVEVLGPVAGTPFHFAGQAGAGMIFLLHTGPNLSINM
jgi:hypothetical protein